MCLRRLLRGWLLFSFCLFFPPKLCYFKIFANLILYFSGFTSQEREVKYKFLYFGKITALQFLQIVRFSLKLYVA